MQSFLTKLSIEEGSEAFKQPPDYQGGQGSVWRLSKVPKLFAELDSAHVYDPLSTLPGVAKLFFLEAPKSIVDAEGRRDFESHARLSMTQEVKAWNWMFGQGNRKGQHHGTLYILPQGYSNVEMEVYVQDHVEKLLCGILWFPMGEKNLWDAMREVAEKKDAG